MALLAMLGKELDYRGVSLRRFRFGGGDHSQSAAWQFDCGGSKRGCLGPGSGWSSAIQYGAGIYSGVLALGRGWEY
jgi:hypothetical protein